MRNWLRLEKGFVLSSWKTRQIKGALEIEHYKVFEQLKREQEAERAAESASAVKQNTEENQPGSEAQESSQNSEKPL
jgi:hypothetical protein